MTEYSYKPATSTIIVNDWLAYCFISDSVPFRTSL